MMQIILLAGICVESIILLCLALVKKLTKKVFWVISFLTLLFCVTGIFMSKGQEGKAQTVNQKEYTYMAARLLEEAYPAQALKALNQVMDEECARYGVRALRGLAYNQNEDYGTVEIYLRGSENPKEQELLQMSVQRERASAEFMKEIVQTTRDALELSEKDMARLDAELKVRFLADYQTIDEIPEAYVQAKAAIADFDYEKAFEIMVNSTDNGKPENAIIISNMYVKNYNLRTLEEADEEYDSLLREATELQTRLNQASLKLPSSQNDYSQAEPLTPEQKEYAAIRAEYSIALDKLNREAVKRAINYMKSVQPGDGSISIAYQLQMAKLWYYADDIQEARRQLAPVFETEKMDTEQWMGLDAYLLKEGYLLMASGEMDYAEFSQRYAQLMSNLYLDLFTEEAEDGFQDFLTEYFRELFSGLRIGRIDTSKYPEVCIEASSVEKEFVFSEETVVLTDTDAEVKAFKVEEKQDENLSICFVLDRSGSMQGGNISDAKKAIRESILSLDNSVEVGLVSFENDARTDSELTDSKYMVATLVDGIRASGGTNIAAGLQVGNQILENASGEKVIILLSDGYDGYTDLLEPILAQLKADNVVVFTIGLSGCDEEYLGRIADATGGSFVSVSNSSRLSAIYEEIQKYLLKTYYISYEVPQADEQERYVHIQKTDSFVQTMKKYSAAQEKTEQNYDREQQSDYFRQFGTAVGGR